MEEKLYFDNINGYYVKDSDVRNALNLSTFTQYNSGNIAYSTNDVTIYSNSRLTVATNSDGTLAKIYGFISFYNPDNVNHVDGYATIQTSLRPEEDIVINCLGTRFSYSEDETTPSSYHFAGGYSCDVTIKTTGEVRFSLPMTTDMYQAQAVISPCLLFIKNFGDTPI